LNRSHSPRPGRLIFVAGAALLLISAAAVGASDGERSTEPAQAEKRAGIFRTALDWFRKGGPIMYPIALTSLVGLAFVIERAAALRKKHSFPESLREELVQRLDELDTAGAMAACEKIPCSLGRVLHAALLRRSGTLQEMEKAAEDSGVRELWQLRRNVRPIGIVASVSPLLGLLGTISGMIGAFKTMGSGDTMGNPSAFAADIHEALFTTFFGLSVAIPMLLCYHWLHGKAETNISEVEETAGNLLLSLHDRRRQGDTSQPPAAGPAAQTEEETR